LTKTLGDYVQLIDTIHLQDGTIRKIGFRSGKWLVKTEYKRVAVSKKGFLLHLDYDEKGRAFNYKLYLDFTEMAADDVDYLLLGKVARALGNKDFKDYVVFLD
jgi:hypothetical protein